MNYDVYVVMRKETGEILGATKSEEYANKIFEYATDVYGLDAVCVKPLELSSPGDLFGDGKYNAYRVWIDSDGSTIELVEDLTDSKSIFSPVLPFIRVRNYGLFGNIRKMHHGEKKYFEPNPKGRDYQAVVFLLKDIPDPEENAIRVAKMMRDEDFFYEERK